MLKKALISIAFLLLIAAAAVCYMVWPFIRGPQFTVTNATNASIKVEATWRGTTKQLGELASNESVSFKVNDEAGMMFTAFFPDGSQISSTPVYFTSGTTVEAVIESDIRGHNTYFSCQLSIP